MSRRKKGCSERDDRRADSDQSVIRVERASLRDANLSSARDPEILVPVVLELFDGSLDVAQRTMLRHLVQHCLLAVPSPYEFFDRRDIDYAVRQMRRQLWHFPIQEDLVSMN